MLELDCLLEFDSSRDEEFFLALPSRPAVCLIEPKDQSAEPFFIRTQDLRRRLERLLGPPEPSSKRLNLRTFARGIRYRLSASPFEQSFLYYRQAKRLFPLRYKRLLRLRPPAVLKINLQNAYPRCYPTRRIAVDSAGEPAGGFYYGPFPSRKSAQALAEGVLDLFKVRRCQIKIRRDPSFPGCIYSEMKMCLAPCFAGCSKQEYDVEVGRLTAFLETSGSSLRDELEAERNQASERLDYEKAALLHKKLDKLSDALRGQPELPRRLEDLNLVVFQRGGEPQSIVVYEIRSGRIAEPFLLSFATLAGEPRSAE
ncbi:MAG TPA: UvrB/UvrC motif-containing protein, partial [Candidatus Acidoferrum sp.]|nr:UvrB/UvrC motif-containing protein [Candidatus Acidoferrum sp.]